MRLNEDERFLMETALELYGHHPMRPQIAANKDDTTLFGTPAPGTWPVPGTPVGTGAGISPFNAFTPTGPFASEDALDAFVKSMTDEQAKAIYALLYHRGVRYDPSAIEEWRRGRS